MKKQAWKYYCVLLILCLFVGLTTGCEGFETNDERKDDDKKSESPSSNDKTESPDTKEPTQKANNSTKAPTKPSYTIKNETIVDNDMCIFRIVEASEDSFWGFKLKVYCENKTSDKTMMFSIRDVSVNGYMADPYFAEEVAAGKKSNDDVSFFDLEDIGVTTPEEITFTLSVYDSDDWSADDFVTSTYTIYPTGLSKDSVTVPNRRTTATEQTMVDNDKASFIILEAKVDDFWGYTLYCYLENKTDKTLMFSWSDVSVNGFMVDPYWADEISPGKRAYAKIDFSDTDFEKNSITTVEDIEAVLRIYDSSDWDSKDVFKDKIIYKPKQ